MNADLLLLLYYLHLLPTHKIQHAMMLLPPYLPTPSSSPEFREIRRHWDHVLAIVPRCKQTVVGVGVCPRGARTASRTPAAAAAAIATTSAAAAAAAIATTAATTTSAAATSTTARVITADAAAVVIVIVVVVA